MNGNIMKTHFFNLIKYDLKDIEGHIRSTYFVNCLNIFHRKEYDNYNCVQVIMTHAARLAYYGRERSVVVNLLVRVFVLLCTEQWPPEAATER